MDLFQPLRKRPVVWTKGLDTTSILMKYPWDDLKARAIIANVSFAQRSRCPVIIRSGNWYCAKCL